MSDRTSVLAIIVMLFVTACAGTTTNEQQIREMVCLGFCQVMEARTSTETESSNE